MARQRITGNQSDFISQLCVKIPFARWIELGPDSLPFTPVVKSSLDEDCISLISLTTEHIITVRFTSPLEYDMVVLEPGAPPFLITAATPLSPNGGNYFPRKDDLSVLPCRTPFPAPFIDEQSKTLEYRTDRMGANPPRRFYHAMIIKRHDCQDKKITFKFHYLKGDSVGFVRKLKVTRTGFKVNDTSDNSVQPSVKSYVLSLISNAPNCLPIMVLPSVCCKTSPQNHIKIQSLPI